MGTEITALSRQSIDEGVASADQAWSLVMVKGREAGRRIGLSERVVVAGRDPRLDIVLPDDGVSRLHCLVSVVNGEVVVEDLGSTNGTFVNGQRIDRRRPLPVGSMLRVGQHLFRCERCTQRDLDRAEEQHRDIQRAASYVQSLLPPPLSDGPIRTEWMLQPSARLGGDALGYSRIDDHLFALYLMDVSGHGVSAAMLSVSVLNNLREHALPATDFRDPVQVLSRLNAMFQMDRHDDQYFTIWYGVYDSLDRTLTYATAGHHASYLVPRERDHARSLKTSGPVIGAIAEAHFHAARTQVPAGSMLYLFSDGVFEVRSAERQWRLADFTPFLTQPIAAGGNECRRLYDKIKSVCSGGPPDDDFSMLVVTFP
jgi:hypothetical protein